MDNTLFLAFFYFDFKVPAKQTSSGFLHSVVQQLAFQSAEVFSGLNSLHTQKLHGQQQPSSQDLLNVLSQSLASTKSFYMVIDALDECGEVRSSSVADIKSAMYGAARIWRGVGGRTIDTRYRSAFWSILQAHQNDHTLSRYPIDNHSEEFHACKLVTAPNLTRLF